MIVTISQIFYFLEFLPKKKKEGSLVCYVSSNRAYEDLMGHSDHLMKLGKIITRFP